MNYFPGGFKNSYSVCIALIITTIFFGENFFLWGNLIKTFFKEGSLSIMMNRETKTWKRTAIFFIILSIILFGMFLIWFNGYNTLASCFQNGMKYCSIPILNP